MAIRLWHWHHVSRRSVRLSVFPCPHAGGQRRERFWGHSHRDGHSGSDLVDYHECRHRTFCVESITQTEGFSLVSSGLHDFLLRRRSACSHDVLVYRRISGFCFERLPVALVGHLVPTAKTSFERTTVGRLGGTTAPSPLGSLACVSR